MSVDRNFDFIAKLLLCNVTTTTEIYTPDTLFPYTTLFRSARKLGDAELGEVMSIVGMFNETNRLVHGFQIEVDEAYLAEPDLEAVDRSEEQTSELQSLIRISYDVFCLKKKTLNSINPKIQHTTS